MKTAKTIIIWIIGIMFIATGVMKLLNLDTMSVVIFARAGYPGWLFNLVAAFELAGGVLMLIKKTRLVGVALIGVVMLGAIGTHLYLKDEFNHMIVPIAMILFGGLIVRDVRRGS